MAVFLDLMAPIVAPEQEPDTFASTFSVQSRRRVMSKTIIALSAAFAALALSGGAYAQNNTLATPTTVSPAAATSGYGTPGAANSDSGMSTGSSNAATPNGTGNSAASSLTNLPGSHNTLATPSVVSPAGQ
jgi:hypothetical protein